MMLNKTLRKRLIGATTAVAVAVSVAVLILPNAGASPVLAGPPSGYEPPNFPETHVGPPNNPKLANIVVIDAGGTLTSTAADRISYLHYAGSVSGGVQTILEDLYPELAKVANITVARSPGSLGTSSAVSTKTLYDISLTADKLLAKPDVDGVVVTAGTNVLEEDAYFLDLTVQSDKPVVVTGSMHQYGTFTYDAYTNLFSSIRLAASKKTTCFGTVVLLNDQFFSARDVTKTDGYRMDTFEGGPYGALGVVNEGIIRTMRAPARVMKCGTSSWKTPFNLGTKTPADVAKVEIVSGYIESSPVPISAMAAAGVKGIVTAGHGPGGISSSASAARQDAIANGVLFVSATRTGGEGTYDTGTAGNIGAADLLPQKARLLLQMGLTFSSNQEQIRTWFKTIGDPEFDFSEHNG
jgi:L-asparaginase